MSSPPPLASLLASGSYAHDTPPALPQPVTFAQELLTTGLSPKDVAALVNERNALDVQAAYGVLWALAALLAFYVALDAPRVIARWRSRREPTQVEATLAERSVPVGGEVTKGYLFRSQRSGALRLPDAAPAPIVAAGDFEELPPRAPRITFVEPFAAEKQPQPSFAANDPGPLVRTLAYNDRRPSDSSCTQSSDSQHKQHVDDETLDTLPGLPGDYEEPPAVTSRRPSLAPSTRRRSSAPRLQRLFSFASSLSRRSSGSDGPYYPDRSMSTSSTAPFYRGMLRKISSAFTLGAIPSLAANAPSPRVCPPLHVSPILSWLPYSAKILLWTPLPRLFPHLTLTGVFLQCSYLVLILIALNYHADVSTDKLANPLGVDFYRSGLIAMVQLPVAIGLGGRNSVIRFVIGGGQNMAIQRVHKLCGRLLFLCALMHSCLYFNKWAKLGWRVFRVSSATPFIVWGYVALAATLLIVVTSLPMVRRRAHGVFSICHYIGIVMLLVGLAQHIAIARPYVYASAACYAFDIAWRAAKTRYAVADLTALQGNDSTLVCIPAVADGWRAGQFVILRVPALSSLNRPLHGLEGHSFTIASAPDSEQGLTLIAKSAGNWSKDLHDLAARAAVDAEKGGSASPLSTRLIVEGPYGGPGHTMFASYSSVLLIGGGSGITHTLALAQDLLHKAKCEPNAVRARLIDVVWVVRTPDNAQPLMPTLESLARQARATHSRGDGRGVVLRVRVFCSRAPSASLAASTAEIEIIGCRPDLSEILHEALDRFTEATKELTRERIGCGVAVCGPDALVVSARQAVRDVPEQARLRVGGVELLEESFTY